MTHDNSWSNALKNYRFKFHSDPVSSRPVAMKFMSIGASKVHDPSQLVMTLDHDVQNQSDTNLKKVSSD